MHALQHKPCTFAREHAAGEAGSEVKLCIYWGHKRLLPVPPPWTACDPMHINTHKLGGKLLLRPACRSWQTSAVKNTTREAINNTVQAATQECKVGCREAFMMPLHQNVKSCLSQPMVSLHRLKAATKQLGRERERKRQRAKEREGRERDWGCGCYSNHLVGLNCFSLAFISSYWASVSLPLSSSTLTFVYPSLSLLFSWLSISLIASSPSRAAALPLSSDLPACLSPSLLPSLLQLPSLSLENSVRECLMLMWSGPCLCLLSVHFYHSAPESPICAAWTITLFFHRRAWGWGFFWRGVEGWTDIWEGNLLERLTSSAIPI